MAFPALCAGYMPSKASVKFFLIINISEERWAIILGKKINLLRALHMFVI